MKKINLMDVMESLNSDDVEGAQAALHEWFVEQGKQVQAQISGVPVVESEEEEEDEQVDESTDESEEAVEEAAPAAFDPAQNDDAKTSAWYVQHEESSNSIKPERYDMLINEIKHGLKFGKDRDQVLDMNLGDGRAMDYAWRVVAPNTHDFPHDVIGDGSDRAGNDPKEYIGYDFIDIKGINVALCYHEYPVEWVDESINESENAENEEEEQVDESYDDLVAELNEAFKGLETVSDKLQNVEGAQVGEQGKVPVNTKATLPSHKGKDRVGGEPVEIKGKGHTGHALETAPKVVDVKVKNTVQNGKEELKKVADKGDAKALLNKRDGKENTQSPISGKGAKGLK